MKHYKRMPDPGNVGGWLYPWDRAGYGSPHLAEVRERAYRRFRLAMFFGGFVAGYSTLSLGAQGAAFAPAIWGAEWSPVINSLLAAKALQLPLGSAAIATGVGTSFVAGGIAAGITRGVLSYLYHYGADIAADATYLLGYPSTFIARGATEIGPTAMTTARLAPMATGPVPGFLMWMLP